MLPGSQHGYSPTSPLRRLARISLSATSLLGAARARAKCHAARHSHLSGSYVASSDDHDHSACCLRNVAT